eukprot:CAMPEP_0194209840 /NCGR_PEP_ID=MMETSP0156-20130528/7828_1 /TAXON_ID=33649 /ORGANISM="Thalassionema nitzschioides, Strain L26-B" /LENGTH=593 /DNA_ID=CAMNT_0038937077 /DNA_START=239 /DNA_END=2020 /DNA_ORIENTATION=+
MKPRSKRNRKRARKNDDDNNSIKYTFMLQPLKIKNEDDDSITTLDDDAIVRTVEPYAYSFSTYAKARWIGRTIFDVYCTEFGAYPPSYYEAAISQGKITVSSQMVDMNYRIKNHDVLSHTVHRHEPAVLVRNTNNINNNIPVTIVADTPDLVVVDKTCTLPVHPCGAYQQNSLSSVLEQHYGKVYIMQRLDRLTSGLVLFAKSSQIAQKWGNVLMRKDQEHTSCQKLYLARVKGKFPMNCSGIPRIHGDDTVQAGLIGSATTSGEENHRNGDANKMRSRNAHGYWITNGNEGNGGRIKETKADLTNVFKSHHSLQDWLLTHKNNKNQDDDNHTSKTRSNPCSFSPSSSPLLWLHLASPCRIANHKDGVCETGDFASLEDSLYVKSVKPAQTSFGVIKYDKATDSTVILCRPQTGRSHQIRLHLQALGHPIANDMCYGGELWYGDERAKKASQQAQLRLQQQKKTNGNAQESTAAVATIADTPSIQDEISKVVKDANPRGAEESLADFIRRTCVWCARTAASSSNDSDSNNDSERAMLELLVRSRGIWLHALRYQMRITKMPTDGIEETSQEEELDYCTKPPAWALQGNVDGIK